MKNKKIEIMRGAVVVVLLPCVALTLLELFDGDSPEQSSKKRRRNIYGDMPFKDEDFPEDDAFYRDDDDADGYDEDDMHYRRQQQHRRYYRQS
ncbi:hypothetical protein ABFA07_000247 [Porites harrisoni]